MLPKDCCKFTKIIILGQICFYILIILREINVDDSILKDYVIFKCVKMKRYIKQFLLFYKQIFSY